jgi:hypothetical protein
MTQEHWIDKLDSVQLLAPYTVAPADTKVIGNGLDIVGDLTIGAGATLTIQGDCSVTGSILCSGSLTVEGNCQVGQHVTNDGGGGIIINGKLDINGNPGAPGDAVFVGGDCRVPGSLTNTSADVYLSGNFYGSVTNATGSVYIAGYFEQFFDGGILQTDIGTVSAGSAHLSTIDNSGAGNVRIYGDCQVAQHVTNSGGGAITINGKLDINGDPGAGEGYLDNTGGAAIIVGNDAHISGPVTNTTGSINIEGRLYAGGVSQMDATSAGAFQVIGKAELGGLDIGGVDTGVNFGNDLNVAGFITITQDGMEVNGNCQTAALANTGAGSVIIDGNVQVSRHVTNSGGGNIKINGKLDINGGVGEGYLNNTGGTAVMVGGDCHISVKLINTTGDLVILGNLNVHDPTIVVSLSNTTGSVVLSGNCLLGSSLENNGAGSVTVNGDCKVAGHVENLDGHQDQRQAQYQRGR